VFDDLVWDGSNLKTIRGNTTQRQIAQELNISQFTVSAWETNKQRPEDDNVVALAEFLQVDPAEFFMAQSEPRKSSKISVPLGTIDPEQVPYPTNGEESDTSPFYMYVDTFKDGSLMLKNAEGRFFKASEL